MHLSLYRIPFHHYVIKRTENSGEDVHIYGPNVVRSSSRCVRIDFDFKLIVVMTCENTCMADIPGHAPYERGLHMCVGDVNFDYLQGRYGVMQSYVLVCIVK